MSRSCTADVRARYPMDTEHLPTLSPPLGFVYDEFMSALQWSGGDLSELIRQPQAKTSVQESR